VIEKVGGFRADTATELAKKLFTSDRAQLDEIIKNIESRMGPERASHFKAIMDHYAGQLARQNAATAATAAQTQQAQQVAQQQQQSRSGQRPPSAQMELPIPPTPQVMPYNQNWPRSPYRDTPPDPKPAPWDKR
jgi:hypothetical protein